MSKWLNQLKSALDSAARPVSFFFRDDDAGWQDESLFRLLDLFLGHRVPIDLAVIPKAVTEDLAARLNKLLDSEPDLVSLHQHGYEHVNNEADGRKHEFGPTRYRFQQLSDIKTGKQLLTYHFGKRLEPIFTPPWNRCTRITGECLVELGFKVLSRDVTASPLLVDRLVELPVEVDWLKKCRGVRVDPEQIGDSLVSAASGGGSVGVMLHHAVMDEDDRERTHELLDVLSSHANAECVLMRTIISDALAFQVAESTNQSAS